MFDDLVEVFEDPLFTPDRIAVHTDPGFQVMLVDRILDLQSCFRFRHLH